MAIAWVKRVALVMAGAILAVSALNIMPPAGVGIANTFGFSPFQSKQTDRSLPVLLKSIQNTSQYHTAVGNFQVIVDVEDDVDWVPGIIAGRRTLFVAAGTVNAYIDLSGLTDKDLTLSADGKSVTVRLPEPQLDKPNLDHDRSYLFSQDRGVLNRIADAIETPQQAQFYQLAETKIAAAAEESELRKQAAETAKTNLTGIFAALDMQVAFTNHASD